jgi:Protein of unknown function (DUF3606)
MSDLTKPFQPDRSHTHVDAPHELKYWARRLGVSQEEIRRAVEKVGSTAETVRKELGIADETP